MPTPLSAVLFDLDGTLVDSLAICFVAFRNALVRSGGSALTDAEIYALFGPSEDGMFQQVLPDRWASALKDYFDEYDRLLPTCPAMAPGLVTALTHLEQRRIHVGLVTGKSRVTAMMSLRHLGIEGIFRGIECGSPTGIVKVDAITRLLREWQVPPTSAAYVGDAATDMRAARDAGVIAVGVAWAHGARAEELTAAGADVIFTTADDFLTWLTPRIH